MVKMKTEGDENAKAPCNVERPWSGTKKHATTMKETGESNIEDSETISLDKKDRPKGLEHRSLFSGAVVVLSGVVNPERGHLRNMVRSFHRVSSQVLRI